MIGPLSSELDTFRSCEKRVQEGPVFLPSSLLDMYISLRTTVTMIARTWSLLVSYGIQMIQDLEISRLAEITSLKVICVIDVCHYVVICYCFIILLCLCLVLFQIYRYKLVENHEFFISYLYLMSQMTMISLKFHHDIIWYQKTRTMVKNVWWFVQRFRLSTRVRLSDGTATAYVVLCIATCSKYYVGQSCLFIVLFT